MHLHIVLETNKAQQNNEGIFQEMTSQIHMHFTKASDVPLNDFNEYWEAVEQERENEIDSGFKKEEVFFSVLASTVCLTVTVICKGTMLRSVPTAT